MLDFKNRQAFTAIGSDDDMYVIVRNNYTNLWNCFHIDSFGEPTQLPSGVEYTEAVTNCERHNNSSAFSSE